MMASPGAAPACPAGRPGAATLRALRAASRRAHCSAPRAPRSNRRAGRVLRSAAGGTTMSETHASGPSVIEQLAAYTARESFDTLPDAAVRAARRAILDTLGVALAGS